MTERRRRRRAVHLGRAAGAALRRILAGTWEVVRRVWDKAGQDNIFFLAGGIAFNLLLAAVPFLLMLVAVFGFVLQRAVDDPQQAAVDYVLNILPPSQPVVAFTRRLVGDVVAGRRAFGILALVLFIWSSTRLFGSLRAVLKDIFDIPEERNILRGKIFDLQMVLVAGTLFIANTGITVVLEAAQRYGVEWLGVSNRPEARALQAAWGRFLAFGFIFAMFFLIYRYLPVRRTPWRTSLVAAAFTSVAWEVLKGIFAWYVSDVAQYRRTYGALVTPVVLVLWTYYSGVVFILGGEIAQVYDLMRTRRKQRELLE
ncbi:MAG TPA: YihY/virulence factor BrkB family protein [Longimicrobiaceae bacterium]|nr:YihY/virulence factor BrkB family protein [Longimicrobiaceae bacterium]